MASFPRGKQKPREMVPNLVSVPGESSGCLVEASASSRKRSPSPSVELKRTVRHPSDFHTSNCLKNSPRRASSTMKSPAPNAENGIGSKVKVLPEVSAGRFKFLSKTGADEMLTLRIFPGREPSPASCAQNRTQLHSKGATRATGRPGRRPMAARSPSLADRRSKSPAVLGRRKGEAPEVQSRGLGSPSMCL